MKPLILIPLISAIFTLHPDLAGGGQWRSSQGAVRLSTQSSEARPTGILSQIYRYKQGYSMRVWLSNMALMGVSAWNGAPPDGFGLEYPVGSGVEHLFGGGPFVGAQLNGIRHVSMGYRPNDATTEFYGNPDGRDSFHIVSPGISSTDVSVAYTDTFHSPSVLRHFPLGIAITQKSLSWSGASTAAVVPIEYTVVNVGPNVLHEVYVGMITDADIGPVAVAGYYNHDYSSYVPNLRLGYSNNAQDRGSTPLGVVVLQPPAGPDSMKYIWQAFDFSSTLGITSDDSVVYSWISGEAFPGTLIGANQSSSFPTDTKMLNSFGPFSTFLPGDTIRFTMALVGGSAISGGPDALLSNAAAAHVFYQRGYRSYPQFAPPQLTVETGRSPVVLHWGFPPGQEPAGVWDDGNRIAEGFADTSWRKTDPPAGHTTGGRIFEGYRIYRTNSIGTADTLLMQFDVAGDQFGTNNGVDTTFTDSTATGGGLYYYAVEAYSLPNLAVVQYTNRDGSTGTDSLLGYATVSRSAVAGGIIAGVGENGATGIPDEYALGQNFPNPFNPGTVIRYQLPARSFVTLTIYDALGREVGTLARGPEDAGFRSLAWDGSGLSSGVYFCRLHAVATSNPRETYMKTMKMLLLR